MLLPNLFGSRLTENSSSHRIFLVWCCNSLVPKHFERRSPAIPFLSRRWGLCGVNAELPLGFEVDEIYESEMTNVSLRGTTQLVVHESILKLCI